MVKGRKRSRDRRSRDRRRRDRRSRDRRSSVARGVGISLKWLMKNAKAIKEKELLLDFSRPYV